MSLAIRCYKGSNLSRYRTYNTAEHFARLYSAEDALEGFDYARKSGLTPFILGAGSNVFFKNSKIKSLVLKNALPREIKELGNDLFEVSSSLPILSLLRYAFEKKRNCCYYLASAPCEVGGAIAMNAGTGRVCNKCIFDFVESVKYIRDSAIKQKPASEIFRSFRRTEFTDGNTFILSAILRLPKTEIIGDPISERLEWARKNQDLSIPNCGSLCDKYNARILEFLRFVYSPFPAGLSRKNLNWGQNQSRNPFYFRIFLKSVKLLHSIFAKELEFEIKIVD